VLAGNPNSKILICQLLINRNLTYIIEIGQLGLTKLSNRNLKIILYVN